ncbi:MAG: hypothetical protein GF346_02010, partial [Candidatus Eisenbacteria bacterium]|nr:hypothetical protein [Candidatus Latescibacterota bacterium]MBD3301206.1 hypothetical protein [Candidatus Eisenbacteria bacterium]
MPARLLLLVVILLALGPAAAGAELPIRVEIVGGAPSARSAAEETARAWAEDPRARDDLDLLVQWIGRGLIDEGWGNGTIAARLDTLEDRVVCRVELEGLAP